jgi:ribonuclease VapC
MVIDTSALVAVLQDEPERRRLNEALESVETRLMSTASFVAGSIIMEARHGDEGLAVDLFIAETGIELALVDVEQARVARRPFTQLGKGRHPAALNHGGCFSYALARITRRPLLFKGADFALTDITAMPC